MGKGAFGTVFLVTHRNTGKEYAMKCIKKDVVIEQNQMKGLELEKDILQKVDHPFIVSMKYIFQNKLYVFFVLEFVAGGDLFRHLLVQRRFTEKQTKFMISQIAMALAHLHKKGIIYRDLKPENILFNKDGYVKVADFGLARRYEAGEVCNSHIGTPSYLAPEVILRQGHDSTVDIWCLGTLIYEMIVGIPPFYSENRKKMYDRIVNQKLSFPDKNKVFVSNVTKDLITKMLEKDCKKRIGAKGGMDEVLKHPYFKYVNFDELMSKNLLPPYKPDLEGGNE